MKLYTKQGNWDLVGNNIPVFFIQDAIKFPDLIHAAEAGAGPCVSPGADGSRQFWDFISLTPESIHMVMWIMSDRAIPRSCASWKGSASTRSAWSMPRQIDLREVPLEAEARNAVGGLERSGEDQRSDPDFHRRDLWEADSIRGFPEWELGVQIFDESSPTNSTSTCWTRPS